MPNTITCSAELIIQRPVEATLAMFTAEGEREWAPGWNPTFPAPERTEGVGAVFVTGDALDVTAWVMVDQDEHGVRYARVTPGATAGTVAVTVVQSDPSHTRLRVSYVLTALSTEGVHWLERFAGDFVAYISNWEAALAGTPVGHH